MDMLHMSADVRTVAVDDSLVLVDQSGGHYYGLDEVGTVIWRLIEGGTDIAEIKTTIGDMYAAPPESISSDVDNLVFRLREAGLVVQKS